MTNPNPKQYVELQSLWRQVVADIHAADSWHDALHEHESQVLLRVLRYLEMAPTAEAQA